MSLMNQISFKRTGHTLLNNGILGVYTYLKKADKQNKFDFSFSYKLTDNELSIQCKELPELLEELYYWMGGEVYDTYTLKQQENAEALKDCNIYYDEKNERFVPFPRMNTYGFTHLLTNNAQGVTRYSNSWSNVKKLEGSDPEKLNLIQNYFQKNNLKLLSKVYFNEPYTKITRIVPFKERYLEQGSKRCYLTGESYAELVDTINISPFFSGILNFNSKFSAGDKKISWQARYLSMFSVTHAFYHYPNKLRETIYIYLFTSDTLVNLKDILEKVELLKPLNQLRSEEFTSNISLVEEFSKDNFTEQFEVALVLIYSFYKKVLKKYGNLGEDQVADTDLFGELIKEIPPFAIDSIKADAFASTMRPNFYQNINRLTTILNLLHYLEKEGVIFNRVLSSLKILKPGERNAKDKFRLERILRNQVAEEFLRGRSILDSLENLFFRSYTYLCSSEYVGFKDYKQLSLFLELYESKINTMEESLQNAAITLGKQIGVKMRHHDSSQNDASNAKKGRGDLINLRKARTQKQFLDELIRIDFKYGLTINEELANKIDEHNYYGIKQFLIIGALNILNPAIHPFKKTETTQ
jgi:hypothetical protein